MVCCGESWPAVMFLSHASSDVLADAMSVVEPAHVELPRMSLGCTSVRAR